MVLHAEISHTSLVNHSTAYRITIENVSNKHVFVHDLQTKPDFIYFLQFSCKNCVTVWLGTRLIRKLKGTLYSTQEVVNILYFSDINHIIDSVNLSPEMCTLVHCYLLISFVYLKLHRYYFEILWVHVIQAADHSTYEFLLVGTVTASDGHTSRCRADTG